MNKTEVNYVILIQQYDAETNEKFKYDFKINLL